MRWRGACWDGYEPSVDGATEWRCGNCADAFEPRREDDAEDERKAREAMAEIERLNAEMELHP